MNERETYYAAKHDLPGLRYFPYRIYLIVAANVGTDGLARLSGMAIADALQAPRQTTYDALNRLCELRYLKREGRAVLRVVDTEHLLKAIPRSVKSNNYNSDESTDSVKSNNYNSAIMEHLEIVIPESGKSNNYNSDESTDSVITYNYYSYKGHPALAELVAATETPLAVDLKGVRPISPALSAHEIIVADSQALGKAEARNAKLFDEKLDSCFPSRVINKKENKKPCISPGGGVGEGERDLVVETAAPMGLETPLTPARPKKGTEKPRTPDKVTLAYQLPNGVDKTMTVFAANVLPKSTNFAHDPETLGKLIRHVRAFMVYATLTYPSLKRPFAEVLRPVVKENGKHGYEATDAIARVASEFWNHHEQKGWVMNNRRLVANWHAAARQWLSREPHFARNARDGNSAPSASNVMPTLTEAERLRQG